MMVPGPFIPGAVYIIAVVAAPHPPTLVIEALLLVIEALLRVIAAPIIIVVFLHRPPILQNTTGRILSVEKTSIIIPSPLIPAAIQIIPVVPPVVKVLLRIIVAPVVVVVVFVKGVLNGTFHAFFLVWVALVFRPRALVTFVSGDGFFAVVVAAAGGY